MHRNVYRLIYRLAEYVTRRKPTYYYRRLTASEKLTAGELAELQLAELKRMLAYAGQYIPYYCELFSRIGFNPASVEKVQDVECIPFLTKDIIRQQGKNLLPQPTCQLIARKTGGSTGGKLTVYYDRGGVDIAAAVHRRCMDWCGKNFGAREVHLSSDVHRQASWREKVREAGKCLAHHRKNIYLAIFDEASVGRAVNDLTDCHPELVQGLPSMLYKLAQQVAADQPKYRPYFRYYEATGETLFDFQRSQIEAVFGCEVFNRYGNAEFGVIAHECAMHQGLHILSDIVYVETIPVSGDTKLQEIVVTGLANYGMPLIRYRTGDLGAIDRSPCSCGLPYPRLINLAGRIHDFLLTPAGSQISTALLLDVMDKVTGVDNFQILATDKELFLYLVPEAGCKLDKLTAIATMLRQVSGSPNWKINMVLVDKLQLSAAGKFRYVVNSPPGEVPDKRLIESNPLGTVWDATHSGAFSRLGQITCVAGFYEIEATPEGNFVWLGLEGKFLADREKVSLNLLNPASHVRLWHYKTAAAALWDEIVVKPGWQVYELLLIPKAMYYFQVEEEVLPGDKNNDPRQLGFGMRSKHEEGQL